MAKAREEFADLFLPALAGLDLLEARRLVLLVAGGEVLEAALVLQPGDALGAGLEVQPQRAFDGDLVEAEVVVVEDLADDALALDGLLGDRVFLGEGPRLAVAEVAEDSRDVRRSGRARSPCRRGRRCLLRLLPRLFSIFTKNAARVDELDLALALGFLAVGEHPDVGGDAGVVEELVGQGDDGLQPVVLDDPLADVALAAAGVAGEERRAVEDDADAAAAVLRRAHLGEHVLEEEQRAVVDARQPGAEAAVVAERCRARARCSVCCCFHSTPKGGLASM